MHRLGSTKCPSTRRGARAGLALVQWLQLVTVALMLAAVAVRGVRGEPRRPPNQRASDVPLVEPLQLLSSSADMRLGEITPRLGQQYRDAWVDVYRIPFLMHQCPKLDEWIPTTEGQRVERVIGELRRGGREEAFAALVLIFEIARATEWEPGLLARTANAERMGRYFQDWLAAWAERAATDPLLYEPAMAATVVYARVMRAAYDAPAIGFADAPFDRAKQFLDDLTGARQPRLTVFGDALRTWNPPAFKEYLERDDFLRGFEKDAQVKFPAIDGECGR